MIAASALRHRLTLTVIARDRDTLGGVTEAASSSVGLWGHVEPVDASERFDQAMLAVRPTHRITIRWRDGVKHRDRLTFRDRAFDVLS
ncbi:MAG: phage head closure protein, partial [Planctomycetia bacterium]